MMDRGEKENRKCLGKISWRVCELLLKQSVG